MFAKLRGRVGVALLGAAIAVILNSTLIACAGITATGAAGSEATAGPAATGATANPAAWVSVRHLPDKTSRAVADCGDGNHAVSGGISYIGASDWHVSGSYPAIDSNGTRASDGESNVRYWAVVLDHSLPADTMAIQIYVFAVCMAN
jgi:hypothetical protein